MNIPKDLWHIMITDKETGNLLHSFDLYTILNMNIEAKAVKVEGNSQKRFDKEGKPI